MALRHGFIVNPGETNCKVSEVRHVNGNLVGCSSGAVFARWRLGVLSLARLDGAVQPATTP